MISYRKLREINLCSSEETQHIPLIWPWKSISVCWFHGICNLTLWSCSIFREVETWFDGKNWLFYENRDYVLDFWSLFLHNGGQVASFSRIKILVSKLISSSVFTFRFKIRISIRKPYRLHVLLNCDEIHKETRRPNSLSTRTWFWIMNWD